MRPIVGLALVVVVLAWGQIARASTIYFDEGLFLAAAGAVSVESFESLFKILFR